MLGLETLYCFLVVLSLLAFYRLWQRPDARQRRALVALCLSLATLTRSEGVMLFVLLGAPDAVARAGVGRGAASSRCSAWSSCVALVVVGPWAVRNLTTFEKPTLLGTGFGWVLAYGNCDAAFYGPKLGYWSDDRAR